MPILKGILIIVQGCKLISGEKGDKDANSQGGIGGMQFILAHNFSAPHLHFC